MRLKNFYLTPIKGYQYISKILPASCRYYPTCSEYASWQFEFNAPYKAFFATSKRILSCNQLFAGGIDYPLVDFVPPRHAFMYDFNRDCGKIDVNYWLVPHLKDARYYVIKDFNAIKRTTGYAPAPKR